MGTLAEANLVDVDAVRRRWAPAEPTPVFDTFWRLAAERQAIFYRRFHGVSAPWTEDSILGHYKFTNAYRASDRVSQYLIRHVIYEGSQVPEEVVFRVVLFKFFNRIETWELLRDRLGEITYSRYSFREYDRILSRARKDKRRIYSAAYIMPSGTRVLGHRAKHRNHLKVIEQMMSDRVPHQLAKITSMRDAFELLRSYPMIGDFLAYQLVTDINYTDVTDFSEMSFVATGPGAKDGIRKCFANLGGLTETEIIWFVAERQEEEFDRLGLAFRSLWGRPLQLIDCQNLLCEVDKYARVAHPEYSGRSGRTRIKQVFRPSAEPIQYCFPPKWGINERIKAEQEPSGIDEATRDGQGC